MYSKFQLAKKYLNYYLTASNGNGHGIHSPFVFDFIKNVLNDKRNFYAYQQIENLHQQLLKDETIIEIEDFGAGSAISETNKRTVSEIVKYSAKSEKLERLLFRLANYYQPKTMIELGTSVGLSSAYLASAVPAAKLITIEGSAAIISIAKRNFQFLSLPNIELMNGNFDDILHTVLQNYSSVDLAFIDGNHRKQPTINYFNLLVHKISHSSILIFDDIHWSKEMEEAWQEIKNDTRVMLSIDLFFIGIVFFKKDFKTKQHFIIRF
jgi:predicted O-methyltransferase YrrM